MTEPRLWSVHECKLELVVGDVTKQDTDAIGNAANAMLLGGGGVDGAIHRAAGPKLLDACRALKKTLPNGVVPTGGAVITAGFELPAKHVVHCVGPIYSREGQAQAEELLARCYRIALGLVREHRLGSIAFPAISTGVYGYPVEEAARVSIEAIVGELSEHRAPSLVRFVLFDVPIFEAFAAAADARIG